MSCPILTAGRWQRLLEDRLTVDESRELREHLASDCSACEQFFETMDEATEARLRAVLDCLTEPRPVGETTEAARAFRAVMERVQEARRPSPWPRWLGSVWGGKSHVAAWAGGVAVLTLVVAGTLLYVNTLKEPLQTEKGASTLPPSIHLEFAVGQHQPDGRFVVDRGVRGGRYAASERLFLRFNVSMRSYVYLVGYRGAGDIDLLFPHGAAPVAPQSPGAHDLRSDGPPEGISLAGPGGRYLIVGISSSRPLDVQTEVIPLIRRVVDPATGLVHPEAADSPGEEMALDAVYFDVRT